MYRGVNPGFASRSGHSMDLLLLVPSSKPRACLCSRFSPDVTNIQTKKLSTLLSFYFHDVLQHLNTLIQSNIRIERVHCFPKEDALNSRSFA